MTFGYSVGLHNRLNWPDVHPRHYAIAHPPVTEAHTGLLYVTAAVISRL